MSLIAGNRGNMTLAIDIQLVSRAAGLPSTQQIRSWVNAAWRGTDAATDEEVVVRVTDEEESERLNHEFRGMRKPTNVLSFPFDPVPGIDFCHIGDLVICAPVVEREAGEQGKTAEAHWAHMVVHGMLHLQGYDHQEPGPAEQMESLETAILATLGFPPPYLDDEKR